MKMGIREMEKGGEDSPELCRRLHHMALYKRRGNRKMERGATTENLPGTTNDTNDNLEKAETRGR